MYYSYEVKALKLIAYSLALISFFGLLNNFMLEGSPKGYVLLVSNLLIFGTFGFFVSKVKHYSLISIAFIGLLYLTFFFAWYSFGGYLSNFTYWYMACAVIFITVSIKTHRKYVFYFTVVSILLLVLAQMKISNLFPPVPADDITFKPYIFSFSTIGVALIIYFLKNSLDTEQEKVLEVNNLLLEKNKLIEAQNEEIKQMNEMLEKQVSNRTQKLREKQYMLQQTLDAGEMLIDKLRHEENFLVSLIDNLPMAIMVFDVKGNLKRWNNKVAAFFQIDEVNPDFNIFDDAFSEKFGVHNYFRKAQLGEPSLNLEINLDFSDERNIRSNRSTQTWIDLSVVPIKDEQDKAEYIITIFEDISVRKNTEENLKISELRLNSIIESTSDYIALFDREHQLLKWNSSYEKAVLEVRDVVSKEGINILEVLPEEESRTFWKPLFDRAYSGEFVKDRLKLDVDEENVLYMDFRLYPVYQNNKIIGVTQFTKDITQEKISEIKRLENEERISSIIKSLPVVVWAVDEHGVFNYSKGKGLEKLGLKDDEVLGKNIFEMYSQYPSILSTLRQSFNEKKTLTMEVDMGGTIYKTFLRPVENDNAGMIGVSLDITDTVKTKKELEISESYLKSIIENTKYSIWAIDKNRNITLVNKSMKKYYEATFGYVPQIGDSALANINPTHKAVWEAVYDKTLQGERVGFEYEINNRFFEIALQPIYLNNEIEGASVFSKDITKRKYSVEKLKERNRFIDNILTTVPALVYVHYLAENRTVYLNDPNFGVLEEDSPNSGFAEQPLIELCHQEDILKLESYYKERESGNENLPAEIMLRLKNINGKWRWTMIREVLLENKKNNKEYLGIAIDIHSLIVKEEELRVKSAEVLETTKQMANYKLMAFRSVMNPHFLFNSLNSIQYFIAVNQRDEALSYLSLFSKLIRKIISSSISGKILLKEEIETIEYYVRLEQIRFENKFDFTLEIDPQLDINLVEIPSLLIQPFIENAIIHGLSGKKGKGKIMVSMHKQDGYMQCDIIDNGVGRDAAQKLKVKNLKEHKSVGVMLTKERLEIINRSHHVSMDIVDLYSDTGLATGTKVKLFIKI